MKNKLIKTILGLTLIFGLNFGLIATTPTFADNNICEIDGVPEDIRAAAGCSGTSTTDFKETIRIILNSIIGILGVVAVIFIVYGGAQYMTSFGDAAKLKKAKDTILYACIGLGICALAFAITNFTISAINTGTQQCSSNQVWDATTQSCKTKS